MGLKKVKLLELEDLELCIEVLYQQMCIEVFYQQIAVKKIMSNNSMQGIREFATEIESLGRLRHKNLLNLQGWCKHKKNVLLVYDCPEWKS